MDVSPFDPLAGTLGRHLLDAALGRFYDFTLVVARLSGLLAIGPLFGQPVVPANVRVLLVLALAFLIAPALPSEAQAAAAVPAGLLDYARIAVGEFGLGFVLGLGVFTLLSGLQLAGELIDQQSGISLGDVFNPALDATGSLSGQAFSLLGVTVFLCMPPVNGHLMMIAALVETFQTLPVGEARVSVPAIELLRDLVHQSLVLGVQVAAPLLATMSLVALTMGFLGHTVPQINVLVIGFPVRALVSLLVLALSFSGAARGVVDLVPAAIDELRAALAEGGLP